tara:strand:+ start:49 stop:615 length:567 start_codon:yes stop_codon:yes gene_type:complete
MDQSRSRADVFALIRQRVASVVPQRLDDKNVLQLALVCGMRENEAVVGMLFPPLVERTAARQKDALAITSLEWQILFGTGTVPLKDGGLTKLVLSEEFQKPTHRLEAAMRNTIAESIPSAMWQKAWARALCYVGMHMYDPDTSIESVLGTLVKADSRRMEELTAEVDDEGCDTMLMSKIVSALSESIL